MYLQWAFALLPVTQALNIISSNDDGWATTNIRAIYQALSAAGHNVVVSAPAENMSGTGSLDITPITLLSACEFNSCPAGSPATGHNASDPRLNYVNSFPVTSIRYGINQFGPPYWGTATPDLAVSGPNAGRNVGIQVLGSGTVGAATYAAHNAGVPAIAFSGTGALTAWNAPVPLFSTVYADAANLLVERLIAGGAPYLPEDTYLNVNFPSIGDADCSDASQIKWVLTRILTAVPLLTPADVQTCGGTRLPLEKDVSESAGCYASVSVGDAGSKSDASEAEQQVVLDRLGSFLSCYSS